MASPSSHAMPEHWTEFSSAKRQQQRCFDGLGDLVSACAKQCGKANVADCAVCYPKALDRMRQRYTESQDREWFTQRKAFLHELEGLFQDAKDATKTLESIEIRIESEKEAWYRWVLRKYPDFIAVSKGGASQEELRSMLDDPDRTRQELVGMMLEGVGRPAGWPSSVEAFANKVIALQQSKDDVALKQFYTAEFFTDQSSGRVLEKAQGYLEQYQVSESMSVEDVMDRIAADMRESRNWQSQRASHQRRLDELRRAKTAFEQDKSQAKSQASSLQQAWAAGPGLDSLSPCHVCQGAVDRDGVLSCSLCQVASQLGGGDTTLTVYCSEECLDKGHDDHVDAEHGCEAGDKCVQLADEDVVMEDDGTWTTVSCKLCLNDKRMTMYCSERCAAENVGEHLERRHGPATTAAAAAAAMGETVMETQQAVEQALSRLNPGLAITLSRD